MTLGTGAFRRFAQAVYFHKRGEAGDLPFERPRALAREFARESARESALSESGAEV